MKRTLVFIVLQVCHQKFNLGLQTRAWCAFYVMKSLFPLPFLLVTYRQQYLSRVANLRGRQTFQDRKFSHSWHILLIS